MTWDSKSPLAQSTVRESQIERLKRVKATRDNAKVETLLNKLTEVAADSTKGNLLEVAVEAALARATLGEISDALEKVFKRYQPDSKMVSGVYKSELDIKEKTDALNQVLALQQRAEAFQQKHGRRPRMLAAKMGQDGHDRGVKVISTGFADMGFDVDIGPLFSTPAEVVRQAIDADVHVIGVSSQAAGHKTLVPELMAELEKQGMKDVVVVIGGVIPPQDYDFLYQHGVAGIFGPGTRIPDAVGKVLDILDKRIQ